MRRSQLLAGLLIAVSWLALAAAAQQPLSMPPAKTAEVFGQKIRYYEAGQGPAVILLHGTASSADVWVSNIGPLVKDFNVYALDQIGFGHSDKPLMDYKIATYVDFLREFMRVVNVPKATLIGHSTGAWIAAQFTIDHPEMVDKLVLADATGLPPATTTPTEGQQRRPDFSFASLAATRSLLESVYYNKKLVSDELVRRVFQTHIQINDIYTTQRLVANRAAEYLGDKLSSIHAPTLLIWGRQDELVPLAAGEQYHKTISQSQMVVIDECGHLSPREKPSEFNKAVLEFLRKP
jgi:pimeloyl-ACP methyl ester carboxylesterase